MEIKGRMRARAYDLLSNPQNKNNKSWYSIKNATSDVAEIYLYDEIGYWGVTAKDFVNALNDVTAGTIQLRVNSPGGDVFDGIAIYNAIKRHPSKCEVTVDAIAASAASFICMAGDTVAMTRNSELMIHDAWGLCVGNAADMRDTADLLDRFSNNIADIYMQKAGGTVESWRDTMRTEAWYSAQEAVDAGLADKVEGDSEEASNKWDLSVFNYAGRDKAPDPRYSRATNQFKLNTQQFATALKEAFQ